MLEHSPESFRPIKSGLNKVAQSAVKDKFWNAISRLEKKHPDAGESDPMDLLLENLCKLSTAELSILKVCD